MRVRRSIPFYSYKNFLNNLIFFKRIFYKETTKFFLRALILFSISILLYFYILKFKIL